ncbi:NDC80 [Mytilus coruscus]|uniref:NDC80 n=1 Tax=Mytilus coruscus TaxID=42192 RepID=A0A6J8CF42_MYTCO|nr:NDC80 [Mytilus coruscus]
MQIKNDLADNQKYSIPDQNNITGKRHEIGRHLNNSDYTVTEENGIDDTGLYSFNVLKLQGKQDGKTTDKNKTTTLSGRENNYTIIDQSGIEQDHEYDVISSHNEICHPSLPEISESATYVVLDPRETKSNRSTDHLCQDCKDVPNKFETSSL